MIESNAGMKIKKYVSIMGEYILEKLYPPVCVFCSSVLPSDRTRKKINAVDGICETCAVRVKAIQEPRCMKCGKPVRKKEQEFCHDCEKKEYAFDGGCSLWIHKMPVNQAIYRYKYANRRIYGKVFAKELWKHYRNQLRQWEVEQIIPVPLHDKKRRKRGYNQAELIANRIGIWSGITVDSRSVIRIKNTTPLKQLNDQERNRALNNAFAVKSTWKQAQNVLIIDDIYTTGCTLHHIAQVLKQAGAEKVYFLTISIGQGF